MINELLQRVTTSLEDRQIPYMLSGSIALSHYSIPRMTLDIDIVIELNKKRLHHFFLIFDQDYYLNRNTVNEETKRAGMFNILDFKTGIKIDFIVRKDTEYRKLEFSRRRMIKIEDFDVWIVSPEDLIISKLIWIQQLQSDKQISDIKNLLALRDLDREYINKWIKQLKLKTFNLL